MRSPRMAGLPEESSEERRTAKKAFFPSSMGLSFLLPGSANALDVTIRGATTPHRRSRVPTASR